MRARWHAFVTTFAAVLAGLGAIGATAQAANPRAGWELSATTYPTNLVQGKDEIQEVVPALGASSFVLRFREEETPSIATAGLTATLLRKDLEALPEIGTGNVEVEGRKVPSEGYLVKFTNALGNSPTPALEGVEANVTVTEEGAASGTIAIDVFNVGAATSSGTITVTDVLPAGLRAKEAGELRSPLDTATQPEPSIGIRPEIEQGVWDCSGNGEGSAPKVSGATVVTCTNDPEGLPVFDGGGGLPVATHGFFRFNVPNPQPSVGISVEAVETIDEAKNKVSIEGGGALEAAATEDAIVADGEPAAGGLVSAAAWNSNEDGTTDDRAGSHPYESNFVLTFATAVDANSDVYIPGGEPRDVETLLPAGFAGDLRDVPQCTRAQLYVHICPPESMVGLLQAETLAVPIIKQIFNMVPEPNVPAEFGFEYEGLPAYIQFAVRSGSDYGIVAHVNDLPAGRETYQTLVTIWGNPSAHSHDRWRAHEGGCSEEQAHEVSNQLNYCLPQEGAPSHAIVSLPTACGAPDVTQFRETAAWQGSVPQPLSVSVESHDESGTPVGLTGCESLGFGGSVLASLETARTDAPSGLDFELTPELFGLEEPNGLAPADIKTTTVTLPEGISVNPGQASNLVACTPAEAELTTSTEAGNGQENTSASECPQGSKVGTATITSPLIEGAATKELTGGVYLLESNPPEIKLLVAASADGVNLKLAGTVHLDPKTGRLTTEFTDTPQLPFSNLKVSFEGGARAALATPTHCGTFEASTTLEPWAAPSLSSVALLSELELTEGAQGGPCPGSQLPFAPTLAVQSTHDNAGAFTGFAMLLKRADGQQRFGSFTLAAPKGLAGLISKVPECGEPAASLGTCPATSRIGNVAITAGPGGYPLAIPESGGPEAPVYLTGPYDGAPFGLDVVTPVVAGPFNLGTIVTRAKLLVNPANAQVSVSTDPLPAIIDGVPTDLRSVYAIIDRPEFLFNPTNCEPQTVSADVEGVAAPGVGESASSATAAAAFGVGACRDLTYAPTIQVSMAGHASKLNGAALKFKISYPTGALGKQSNFRMAKFVFPTQLPSRLETLQQACDVSKFTADPSTCPVHSKVGTAIVKTPVLPVPLVGTVYLVSHKGESFPQSVMVLSGDNVTVELVGETLIRHGVTSVTFHALPDVPFSSVEVSLPTGRYSLFGANLPHESYNFCARKLTIPTALVAQNGLEIHRSTAIKVTGCRTHHRARRAAKKRKH
jgi:hypothetical protein